MFNSNNHASFYLWWRKKIGKVTKIIKILGPWLSAKFLLSMSFLTPLIFKNSHILTEVYFIFLKRRPGSNLKVFRCRILTSTKGSERKPSIRQNLALFATCCSNFRLKLCWSSYNWKSKKVKAVSRDNHGVWTKYLRQALVLM